MNLGGETVRELPRGPTGRALAAGQRGRHTDDHLDSLVFGRELGDSVHGGTMVAPPPSPHRLHRACEKALRITTGDTDPDGSDVDAEAHSRPHVLSYDPRNALSLVVATTGLMRRP